MVASNKTVKRTRSETEALKHVDGENVVEDESEDHEAYLNEKMCNEDCFDNLWRNLSNPRLSFSERQSQCHLLHAVSSAYMYSTLCRNILSDLKEHREVADKHGKVHRKHLALSVVILKGLFLFVLKAKSFSFIRTSGLNVIFTYEPFYSLRYVNYPFFK